jgi:hypothetical protein
MPAVIMSRENVNTSGLEFGETDRIRLPAQRLRLTASE